MRRCLSTLIYRRVTAVFVVLVAVALMAFFGRNLLDTTTILTLETRRDIGQLLIWLHAILLPLCLLYGANLAFLWREADEARLVVARQPDGAYRVSRLGKREFLRSINEVRACAIREQGYRRRKLLWRWFVLCISLLVVASIIVMVASMTIST